ncbi:MAG: hypothetical protein VB030_00795 [Eubacterium aggregans]|uniref:Uncharacterized protein n=1 Tax=Eubacterium aggregans TaxID=81409 RepID=A0A1H3XQP8_9FIRM|nr:hypothetical protein [Eubacterium aggregans]MDD4690801.1 hypothetical protein [Eubacterium aggregans]MEA5072703.1 hypothetical protein [Eubacterium aggregans]SEA01709.1 hypothetical protein SAMN04515656_102165 [Eubacterium aggregans]
MDKKTKESREQDERFEKRVKAFVYIILRVAVVGVMIAQIYNQNWNNVFLCVLTLVLFMIPTFVDKQLHIELPTTLEVIIVIFIFSAEILGEIQEYYLIFGHWDAVLHTINGFLMAAIGFSLIDILNRNENVTFNLSPAFVAVFAFCFSMTIGVLWEFYEFFMDMMFKTDMQKDTWLPWVSSVFLNPDGANVAVAWDINRVVINGQEWPGYIDIGLIDTMSDLFVNFVGAVVFSIFGLIYIKNRKEDSFVTRFMPRLRRKRASDEENIE